MNILYVCADAGVPVLGGKGASVHVREMCAAFARGGHHVILAATSLNKSPWDKPAEARAKLIHLMPDVAIRQAAAQLKSFAGAVGETSSLASEVRRILHNQEIAERLINHFEGAPPDFVYERLSLFSTAGVLVARALGRPIVIEMNAPLAQEQATYRAAGLTELASASERWVLANATHVVVVSEPLRNYAIACGAAPDAVHVSPNGVDPEQFKPAPRDPQARARWGLHDGPLLGFVGGMRPWHDVGILPRLLRELARTQPNVQLIVVGDGPVKRALSGDLESLGLRERVVFTDWVPHNEVPGLIRACDIALAPYAQGGQDFYFSPLKLFEYMGCGVPVVAANIGQIGQTIMHGETGLLYEPGDAAGMAAACDRLLNERGLHSRISQASAALVHADYTWDSNASRVIALTRSPAASAATDLRPHLERALA